MVITIKKYPNEEFFNTQNINIFVACHNDGFNSSTKKL
jgi:hypothetical protein